MEARPPEADRAEVDRAEVDQPDAGFGGFAQRLIDRIPSGRSAIGRRTSTILRRLLADRRIRYLAVGGIASVIYYGFFTLGYLLLGHRISAHPGVSADIVALIANFATAVATFRMYRTGVFDGNGPWLSGFLRFYLISFWALLWSLVGLPLLIGVVGMPALLAQAIIIVLVPLLNYPIHIFWTFRRR